MQIATRIEVDIFAERLKPGDRLPSVRDFAFVLNVNPNTVQRALNELEEKELIFTERTNGKFVTEDKKLIDHYRRKYAEEITREYKNKMREIRL